MADNYSGRPRPAVVLLNDGGVRAVIEREAWEDVVRLQRPLAPPAYTL